MSKNDVNIGASPDDGNGDPLRTAFNKLNNTLAEVYSGLGNGSDLSLSLTSNGILNVTTKVTSTATVTTDAATTLTTKGYVDSQFNTADTLPEVLTRGNTTGGSDIAVSADDDITFTDSSEAIFGSDADLKIYHNGTNAKIVNSTGDLNISGADVNISSGKLDVVNTTGELALQVTGGTTDTSGNFATEIRIRGNKANNATARNVGGVKWYNNEVGATDPDDDEIASIIVDQTAGGSAEAEIEFNVLHCDSMNERMRIFSNGKIKFNAYENTDLTGTPTYILGTTVTGDVVKVLGSDIPLDYLPLAGGALTGALTGTSATFTGSVSATGVIFANRTLEVLGQNLTHGASRIKICQENTNKSQIRYYGADASTKGSLEFIASTSDGSSFVTPLSIDSSGNAAFAGNTNISGSLGVGMTTAPSAKLSISKANFSTNFTSADAYIRLGKFENGNNEYQFIGFGYNDNSAAQVPAYFGFQQTGAGNYSNGALVFGTRNVTTDTAPTERLRIDSSGNSTFAGQSGSTTGTGAVYVNNADDAFALVINNAGTSNQNDRGVFDARVGTTSVFRINNSGNVGIGIINPSIRLAVASPSDTSVVLGAHYSSTNTNMFFQVGINSNDGYLNLRNSSASTTVHINSDGNSYFNGGNVGINVTDPDAQLEIVNSLGGSTRLGYSGGSDSYFDSENFYVRSGNGNTNKFVINSSGNVGIGSTSPSALLEIQTLGTTGSQDFQIFSRGVSPNYEVFKISRSAGNTELLANQNLTLSADYDANHTSVDSNIIFKTDNAEKMRILSSGGITFNGDTSTSNALDDYEEGTWTPSFTQLTGNGAATATLTGTYTKIGNQVFYTAKVDPETGLDIATLAGNTRITNLPFAVGGASSASGGAGREAGLVVEGGMFNRATTTQAWCPTISLTSQIFVMSGTYTV
jgi:hypothetical protein